MAISINFNGEVIFKPGAYTKTVVNLTGASPLQPSGIVGIIGEAIAGPPGDEMGVLTFTSEDISALQSIYQSGPIVDGARMLKAPARDQRVANGANFIRVYKTNQATQASLILMNVADDNLMTLTSRNWGEPENLISVKVENGLVSGSKIITLQKGALREVLSQNANETKIEIQYTGAGSAATLTIQSDTLETVVTGAPGDNLSIPLAGKTIQDLVDLIENFDDGTKYAVTVEARLPRVDLASDLDPISTPLDIMTAAEELKSQQKELMDIINSESTLVSAELIDDIEGTLANFTKKLLAGGSLGASANSDFQAGFDAMLSFRCNTMIPLISRDASALATEGLTDASSSFTLSAVNLQAVTHCITASNTLNRSERNCYVSIKDAFEDSMEASRNLNSERASMLFQDVEILGTNGSLKVEDPWAAACIVAGIQAGTEVGEPATFKRINVNAIKHEDYRQAQVNLAIQAGLLPLEQLDSGGFRVVVHNTTYTVDNNFVYNRVHVLEAADHVAYNLRKQLEDAFTGTKARTGTKEAIFNKIEAIMTEFLNADITVGDDTNDNLGYKDLVVIISGNKANIEITVTPVQGIDFILPTITLDDIRQS